MKRILPLFLLLAAPPVLAGPPAVCWHVEIGDAKSLPWGAGDFAQDEKYDAARAAPDALELLARPAPVLVRMETLRRASLYLQDRPRERDTLLRGLLERVLDAPDEAHVWFDAGYAYGCFEQLGVLDRGGTRWVERALALQPDPEIEFALSLLRLMDDREAFFRHLAKAGAGAEGRPLLAKNLELLKKRYPPVLKYFEGKEKG